MIFLIFALIFCIALDGLHPFDAYKNLAKKDWHDYDAMRADAKRVGAGEGGKPLAVAKDDTELAKKRVI